MLGDVLGADHATPGGLPDDIKLQMVKRLLNKGLKVRKHGRAGKPHDTILYLNETIVFWQVRNALKAQADSKIVKKKAAASNSHSSQQQNSHSINGTFITNFAASGSGQQAQQMNSMGQAPQQYQLGGALPQKAF